MHSPQTPTEYDQTQSSAVLNHSHQIDEAPVTHPQSPPQAVSPEAQLEALVWPLAQLLTTVLCTYRDEAYTRALARILLKNAPSLVAHAKLIHSYRVEDTSREQLEAILVQMATSPNRDLAPTEDQKNSSH